MTRAEAWAAYDAAEAAHEKAHDARVVAQHDEEQARWTAQDLRRVAKAHGPRPEVKP